MLFSLTSYTFCFRVSFFNEQLYDFGFEISLYHNLGSPDNHWGYA